MPVIPFSCPNCGCGVAEPPCCGCTVLPVRVRLTTGNAVVNAACTNCNVVNNGSWLLRRVPSAFSCARYISDPFPGFGCDGCVGMLRWIFQCASDVLWQAFLVLPGTDDVDAQVYGGANGPWPCTGQFRFPHGGFFCPGTGDMCSVGPEPDLVVEAA